MAAAPAPQVDQGPVLSPGDILAIVQRTATEFHSYCMQDPRGVNRDILMGFLEKMAHMIAYFPAPSRPEEKGNAKGAKAN
jgi:hypothetical protein